MKRQRKSATVRLAVETLENRACPSCSVELVGATLTITGDAADNSIFILDNGPGDLQLVCDGTPSSFSEPIDAVVVRTGNGNDFVIAGSFLEGSLASRSWALDLGDGDDGALVDLEGIIDAPISVTVTGGAGVDTIYAATAALIDSNYRVTLDGGNDTDFISTFHNGTLNGAMVSTCLGGNGDDLISDFQIFKVHGTFEGHADGGNGSDMVEVQLGMIISFDPELPFLVFGFDVATGGQANYDMTGGDGHDALFVNYLGHLDGQLNLRAGGGRGSDELFAILDIHAESTGCLSAQFLGGHGDDDMRVRVRSYETEPVEIFPGVFLHGLVAFSDTPAPLSERSITADGGAGFDTCLHSALVSLLNVEDEQTI